MREAGLELVYTALQRQSMRDFEWIIVAPFKPKYDCVHIPEPEKKEGEYWSIYSAYNEAIRHAKGELIVSWQDYTFAEPEGLSKFWYHHTQEPNTCVTGVGNKYTAVYPELGEMVWKDPRERIDQGTFYQCFPNDIEFNYCAIPKQAFYDVGGFDEELNKWSSCCGLDMVQRLDMIGGYDFKIDQTNRTYSLHHGRLAKWEEHNPFSNGEYDKRKKVYEVDPVLNYLHT